MVGTGVGFGVGAGVGKGVGLGVGLGVGCGVATVVADGFGVVVVGADDDELVMVFIAGIVDVVW